MVWYCRARYVFTVRYIIWVVACSLPIHKVSWNKSIIIPSRTKCARYILFCKVQTLCICIQMSWNDVLFTCATRFHWCDFCNKSVISREEGSGVHYDTAFISSGNGSVYSRHLFGGGIPPPKKKNLQSPPNGCQIVCSKTFFRPGQWIKICHGNFLLMDNTDRKLFVIT